MKDIVINPTLETKTSSFVDTSGVSNFRNGSHIITSCDKVEHNRYITEIINNMLMTFTLGTSGCTVKRIYVHGKRISVVTIKANKDNTVLFTFLKKLGILTSRLTIGCSGNFIDPILYVTPKIKKELSLFSTNVQFSIVTMFINLVYTCVHMFNKNLELSLVSGDILCNVPFEDFVISFSTLSSVTVKEMPTEDYTEVCYLKSKYCSKEVVEKPICKTVISQRNDKDEIIESSITPIVGVEYGLKTFPFVLSKNHKVYTTLKLSGFECLEESFIDNIVNLYTDNVEVRVKTLDDETKETLKNYSICNSDDETYDIEEFFNKDEIKEWFSSEFIETYPDMSPEVISNIEKEFMLKLPPNKVTYTVEEIKNIYKDDSYAQQLYKQVQPYYDTFDLGPVNANITGFIKGTIYSMLFIGNSGTGKSTAARVLPYRCGLPYISINFSVNIEESDIFGSMIPNPEKSKPEDPEFIWQDGALTKAVRNGYCVVLEELNFARPGVIGKLNSLLDETRQIDLPTGEILKAHPNFRIIATCNIAYEGTNRFNKALVNRFDDCTVFKDVDRANAYKIIKERTGYKNVTKMSTIYDVYESIRKFSTDQNLDLVISMRQLLNIFTIGRYYKDAYDAVLRIMINGAFIEEEEYRDEYIKSILPAFKLNFRI